MSAKLKAYRCTDCDDEFAIVMLNKEQLTTDGPYCPGCGSDEYVSSIDCVRLSLSESAQEYEIHKSFRPIPGVPQSGKLEHIVGPVYWEAIQMLDPKWRDEFLNFVETGDASKDFLTYIEQSEKAQKAVEMIFRYQSEAMQKFSRALSKK